jgi:hypothetical protein
MPAGVGGLCLPFRAGVRAVDAMREPRAARGRSCQRPVSRKRPGLAIARDSKPADSTEHGPEGILGTVSQR